MTIPHVLRWNIRLALLMVAFVGTLWPQSVTYFVDAASGNDSFDGKSPATAWSSLSKVNATVFQPGDTIYFKSGSVWTGQLMPRGSGASGKPIVISAYGGAARPLIQGAGVVGKATVYLHNQEYWEITDLEITNDAPTGADRRGVLVAASNFGVVHHIYLKNLEIHDVKGLVGDDDVNKRTAGIGIETTDDGLVATRYDDVLIEGCTIYSIDNTGIYTDNLMNGSRSDYPGSGRWLERCFTNTKIRKNTIHHIAKNAMIVRFFSGGVVEHNVCYETALKTTGNTMFTSTCDGTVFQFNEGYLNRSTGADGSMYDADLRSPNTIWQYSYSHDNAHGLFWTCTVQADANIVCRYNISQNDRGIIFCINYPNTSVYCYNNTVFCGPDVTPTIISERNVNTGTRTYYFYNNIIYNISPAATYDFRSTRYTRVFDGNVFFGNHPPNEPFDAHKLIIDPQFVDPGGGLAGISTLDGYKLKQTSPCINSGVEVSGNGGFDFWQNTVPSGGKTDRGAFEYSQSTGVLDGATPEHRFALSQNYPNPFNPDTNIYFQLERPEQIVLEVFNLAGKTVRMLRRGVVHPGAHIETWDGTDDRGIPVSSGVYYARLSSGTGASSIKMILLR